MKVIHAPFYKENPYQTKLTDAIKDNNVEIEFKTSFKHLFKDLIVRREKADIVHLHWLPKYDRKPVSILKGLYFVGRVMALKVLGYKLAITVHNIVHHESTFEKLDLFVYRSTARMSDALFVHAPSTIDKVAKEWKVRDKNKIVVTYHASYIGSYNNIVSSENAKQKFELEKESMSFLIFGGIRPYKEIIKLIKLFEELDSSSNTLIIAGRPVTDEFDQQIKSAIKDDNNIIYHNHFIDDEEVQNYMNAADAVVLPYKKLLTSGSALLAMSFGKACIAPKLGSIIDVLDENGAILYDQTQPQGLKEALHKALECKNRLNKMGEHNYQKATEWSWDNMAKTTVDTYQKL